MTKILILGILYSAAERAIVVTKLVILNISFLTSFVLALRETLVAKLAFFLTPSFFTASLS